MNIMKLNSILFFMFLLSLNFLSAQGIEVSGTVTTAEEGMLLPGASVFVKGTSNGTSTDFDGNYILKNVPEDGILVFTFVGYSETEIPVNGNTKIDVALKADSALLDEVVLTG